MTFNSTILPKTMTFKAIARTLLLGYALGLSVICFFVFSVNEPKPEWGSYWWVRPVVVTPIVSALGMLSFFLKAYVRPKSDVMRWVVFLISFLGFIVALWLGIILGLDGTLWN